MANHRFGNPVQLSPMASQAIHDHRDLQFRDETPVMSHNWIDAIA
jgi:hypothetical protein